MENLMKFLFLTIHTTVCKYIIVVKKLIPCPKREWVSIFLLLTYFRGKSVRFKGSANIIKSLQNGNTINRFVASNQAAIAGKLWSKQCCDGLKKSQHRHSIDFQCCDVLIECDNRHSIGFNNMNTTSLYTQLDFSSTRT